MFPICNYFNNDHQYALVIQYEFKKFLPKQPLVISTKTENRLIPQIFWLVFSWEQCRNQQICSCHRPNGRGFFASRQNFCSSCPRTARVPPRYNKSSWMNESIQVGHPIAYHDPLQQWCVRSLWFLFPMILQPAWVNTHANEPTIIRFSSLARNPDRNLIPGEWLKD